MTTSGARKNHLVDGIIVLGFGIFALLYQLGRWQGASPYLFLESDAANIAGFAAAWDHPMSFVGDPVLGDPRNFRMYSVIHIPILRTLAKWTGDYGTAFLLLLGPAVFVHATGFYLLGRVVFLRRLWAVILAIVTLMPVTLNLGEYWGLYQDAQPRFVFQALLPLLLAAAYYWRSVPAAWPWLMGAAGLLIYIHPPSVPAWGLAIWSGLWVFHPPFWSLKKRLGYMALLGGVSVFVALPFLLHVLQNQAHGSPQGAAYDQIREIMVVRFTEAYLDVPTALKDFILLWSHKWFLWVWAFAGTMAMVYLRPDSRKDIALVGIWLAGLLTASVGIPFTEQAITRYYHLIPVEIDLIRGLRYTIPFMLLLCVWPLTEIDKKLERAWAPLLIFRTTAVIGVFAVLIGNYWQDSPLRDTVSCWRRQKLVCMTQREQQTMDALIAVHQHTPPGATILPTAYELPIRYYALRPVVYAWKDGSILAYTNRTALVKWYETYKEWMASVANEANRKNPAARIKALVVLSRKLGADYLFVDFVIGPDLAGSGGTEIIWSNGVFSILKIDT